MTSKACISLLLVAGSPLGVLIAGGCASSGAAGTSSKGANSAALHECDPLSASTEQVTLGVVVAAGRAADGTVYVIDRATGTIGPRLFISDGTVLRQASGGTGETPDFIIISTGDDSNPLQVRVELVNGTPTRMGVFRGPPDPKTKSFEIGVQGEQLTLIAQGDLSTFTPVSVSSVQVAYDATTADGHRFMAFTAYSGDSTEYKVFYGTDDHMVQRKVLSVSQDSSTHIGLDLDGVETTAQLVNCSLSGNIWGLPRLQMANGSVIPFTPVPGTLGSECFDAVVADAGDARDASEASDAGRPSSRPTSAQLVAGRHFYCF